MFKNHTHIHTQNTTKYLQCYKIYKCNNYEYNKHNLIFKRGYRFAAQHCTIVNINARPQKKLQYNTHKRIQEIYLQTEE